MQAMDITEELARASREFWDGGAIRVEVREL